MEIKKNNDFKDVRFKRECYVEIIDFTRKSLNIAGLVDLSIYHSWMNAIKFLFLDGFTIKQIKWGISKVRQHKTSPQWSFFRNVAYILFETREQALRQRGEKTDQPESIAELLGKYL